MTADADTLAALNWTQYSCQCPVHPCHLPAAYVVHVHAIDACNEPGLDPFGNRVGLRCGSCVRRLQLEVARKLAQLRRWGAKHQCSGCGSPIVALGDVLRELGPL